MYEEHCWRLKRKRLGALVTWLSSGSNISKLLVISMKVRGILSFKMRTGGVCLIDVRIGKIFWIMSVRLVHAWIAWCLPGTVAGR